MLGQIFYTGDNSISLPDFMYMDTNTFIDLAYKRKYQNNVADFLLRAESNNTVLTYSDHVIEELLDNIHYVIMNEKADSSNFKHNKNKRLSRWKQYENLPHVNHGTEVLERFDELYNMITNTDSDLFYKLETPSSEELNKWMKLFIEEGIPPKDAKHAAIMKSHEINDIFTNDFGFTKSSLINVYGHGPRFENYVYNQKKKHSY